MEDGVASYMLVIGWGQQLGFLVAALMISFLLDTFF